MKLTIDNIQIEHFGNDHLCIEIGELAIYIDKRHIHAYDDGHEILNYWKTE